jgi:8-oxo-dGTP pyrophosphatase MutT (NUDIX family)
MARLQTKRAVSAGGVVCRENDGQLEVLLCGRSSQGLWALPKGTPDQGENLEQTAVREVEE